MICFAFIFNFNQQVKADTISDLTGYTWVANVTPYVYPNAEYYLNFSSNSADFTRLKMQNWDFFYYAVDGYLRVFRSETSAWTNSNYQTISITGGSDVTNSILIAWLEANGTLTAPQPSTTDIYINNTLLGSYDPVDLIRVTPTGLYNMT